MIRASKYWTPPRAQTAPQREQPAEKTRRVVEATTGFEPVNGGFADLCLTTWPRRRSEPGIYEKFPPMSTQKNWSTNSGN